MSLLPQHPTLQPFLTFSSSDVVTCSLASGPLPVLTAARDILPTPTPFYAKS